MFIQGEETKANAADGFLLYKGATALGRLFLVLSSRVGRGGAVLAGPTG